MTGEHVWPDWLARFVIEEVRAPWVKVGGKGIERIWGAPMFHHKVKRVCEPCNNEWLDQIDKEVRPILRWLIIGRDCSLDAESQRKLAFWATLRMFMAQFVHGQWSIPRGHYRWVREYNTLPSAIGVWLASYGGRRHPVFASHHTLAIAGGPSPEPTGNNGYFCTFSVGRFVAQVFGHYLPNSHMDLRRPSVHQGFVQRIWPDPVPFNWPPPKRLTDRQLAEISEFSLDPAS
jgi:hypothetical protein